MEKHTKTVSRITGDVKCSCGYFYCEDEPEDEPTIRHIEDVDERHLDETCGDCRGTGFVNTTETMTDKDGRVSFRETDCPSCGGTGEVEVVDCPRCKGTGEVEGQVRNRFTTDYMDDVPLVCNVCDGKGKGRAEDMEEGERLYDWANAPTLEELQDRPTECVGQTADLKLERYEDAPNGDLLLVRYWLNRVGPPDGEHYKVDVEARTVPNGTWATIAKLYPYSRWHTMHDRGEG